MDTNRPLCFVLMPFGQKVDASGLLVDFDAVYREIIAPAIEDAEMEPLRADEEMTGGVIHKPMFERLVLCEFAVADLSTANANVFYELGVRHAVRPYSTALIFSGTTRLPFDVAPLRAMPYQLNEKGVPANADAPRAALAERLRVARDAASDSPVFEFVEGMRMPDIDHTKTDSFRDRVQYSKRIKEQLAGARKEGVEAVRQVENDLDKIANQESAVAIDLLLSYRAVKAWDDMIALVEKMSKPLAATVMVQEQLALALNRAGQGERAERVVLDLLQHRGPSSETYGILGRIYKDRWEAALKSGDEFLAQGELEKAVNAYLRGFETDLRDAYPGINAVTLMEISDPPDPRREKLIPVVSYAVERKISTGQPDYWDHATVLELAVLAKDEQGARRATSKALAAVRESWEPETTARNLRLIREAREKRGEPVAWALKIEQELGKKAGR